MHEEARGSIIADPAAERAARAIDGDSEARILVRAGALADAKRFRRALTRLCAACQAAIAVAVVLAAVAGAGAAQAVFGGTSAAPVNIFLALASLLGVNLVVLTLWTAAVVIRPSARPPTFLGRLIFHAGRWIAGRLADDATATSAAVQAASRAMLASAVGRWALSAISHGAWLAFLLSAMAMALFVLSTRHVTFGWETTILSERQFVLATRAIGWLPAQVGFSVPDPEQVMASRWTGQAWPQPGSERLWSGFLIGCLAIYGALPRAVLAMICAALAGRAARRYRLDVTELGYARLVPRVTPVAHVTGIVDPERPPPSSAAGDTASFPPTTVRPTGPTAILGLEIAPPTSGWPPRLSGIEWLDLGVVDTGGDRQRALHRLASSLPPPRLVVAVCALPATPDRGIASFLARIGGRGEQALFLVLTEGQRLRERIGAGSGRVRSRLDDWRQLATAVGVPDERVIETDLDHLTEASRRRLSAWLGGAGGAPTDASAARSSTRTVDAAFARIVDAVGTWRGRPDDAARAALQHEIARLYSANGGDWRRRLALPRGEVTLSLMQLTRSAEGMIAVLPERLRRSRRWLTVGAAAGALGCVAAAALVTPVALVALPAWVGTSAVIGAVIGGSVLDDDAGATVAADPEDVGDAVATAALFALVLELQGDDEATITHRLDRVIGDAQPPRLTTAAAAADWLAALRSRLDDVHPSAADGDV